MAKDKGFKKNNLSCSLLVIELSLLCCSSFKQELFVFPLANSETATQIPRDAFQTTL